MKLLFTITLFLTMSTLGASQDKPPKRTDILFHVSQGVLVGSTAFDYGSGLRLPHPQYYETGAMGNNRGVQALFQFGTTAGILALTRIAHKRGNHKAGILGNLAMAGVHTFAGIHNWGLK